MVTYMANLPLMKLNIITEILEALFIPKPHEYMKRNQDSQQYGNGLIPIPVPNKSNRSVADQIREANRK